MGDRLRCLQNDHLFRYPDYISTTLHIFHFSVHVENINVPNKTIRFPR